MAVVAVVACSRLHASGSFVDYFVTGSHREECNVNGILHGMFNSTLGA